MKNYTQTTFYFDYENPNIQTLINEFKGLKTHDIIEGLYIKVRDGWRYNPFTIGLTKNHFVASKLVKKTEGHCIDKAILYITGLRALNIPARLHLAKVSNHIATERLEKKLGTNELAPHGLVNVYHNNKWVKCSPAFNKELCAMYKITPLDFNGTKDSILQEYNSENKKFMSYLEDYGYFDDVPFEFILNTFKDNYPNFYNNYKDEDEVTIT